MRLVLGILGHLPRLLPFLLLVVAVSVIGHHFLPGATLLATTMAWNGVNTYESDVSWQGDPYGFGDSPGMVATSPYNSTGVMTDGGMVGGPVHQAGRDASAGDTALTGNPIQGMVIFLILVGILMFIIHHFGKEDNDFTSIRASVYNVALMSVAATAGIPLVKGLVAAYANANLPGGKPVYGYVKAA